MRLVRTNRQRTATGVLRRKRMVAGRLAGRTDNDHLEGSADAAEIA